MVLVLSFSSHFLSDFHVDRTTLDKRPEDPGDPDSFGFQLIELPTEESCRPSDIATVESSTIYGSGTDDEAGYFLDWSTGKKDSASVSDDWYILSSAPAAVSSDHPPLESGEPAADVGQMPQLRVDAEKCRLVANSVDPAPTFENVYIPSDVAALPDDVCVLPVQFEGETYHDVSFLPPRASDDIPPFASNISLLHTAGVSEQPTSQLRAGETAILPAVEEITSPLVTSSSMFLAAVEVCQSSDQLLSLSVCEPVYAHPDVVCLEPSFDSERPIVLEQEPTYGGDLEEQRVPFGLQFPAQSDFEEIRQPDGSVMRRRVIRTSVRRVATRRVRRRQPDGRVVEYTETVELPQEDVAGSDGQLSELVGAAFDPTSDVSGPGAAADQVVGVHTDTAQSGEPRVDTDVEVVRETLPDGRVIERRIVRTRQRKTVVKRVVVRPDRP